MWSKCPSISSITSTSSLLQRWIQLQSGHDYHLHTAILHPTKRNTYDNQKKTSEQTFQWSKLKTISVKKKTLLNYFLSFFIHLKKIKKTKKNLLLSFKKNLLRSNIIKKNYKTSKTKKNILLIPFYYQTLFLLINIKCHFLFGCPFSLANKTDSKANNAWMSPLYQFYNMVINLVI